MLGDAIPQTLPDLCLEVLRRRQIAPGTGLAGAKIAQQTVGDDRRRQAVGVCLKGIGRQLPVAVDGSPTFNPGQAVGGQDLRHPGAQARVAEVQPVAGTVEQIGPTPMGSGHAPHLGRALQHQARAPEVVRAAEAREAGAKNEGGVRGIGHVLAA